MHNLENRVGKQEESSENIEELQSRVQLIENSNQENNYYSWRFIYLKLPTVIFNNFLQKIRKIIDPKFRIISQYSVQQKN